MKSFELPLIQDKKWESRTKSVIGEEVFKPLIQKNLTTADLRTDEAK